MRLHKPAGDICLRFVPVYEALRLFKEDMHITQTQFFKTPISHLLFCVHINATF